MTNIEKVNKALENADESKIKEVLDFLGYEEDSKFIPKQNEQYWLVDSVGKVGCFPWSDDNYDNYQLSLGNIYRTKKEAEQALDFQTRKAKLIKEIEDSSDVIDWGNIQQYKYCIGLDGRYGSLRVHNNSYVQVQGTIYTTNVSFLEELATTRANEVRELLFGVK